MLRCSAWVVVLALLSAGACAPETISVNETDAIRVQWGDTRIDDGTIEIGEVRARMKQASVPGIRLLYLAVLDDKDTDGEVDPGEELFVTEQPYATPLREIRFSCTAPLPENTREDARLALVYRLEFAADGRVGGFRVIERD